MFKNTHIQNIYEENLTSNDIISKNTFEKFTRCLIYLIKLIQKSLDCCFTDENVIRSSYFANYIYQNSALL